MADYTGIAEATNDVQAKLWESKIIDHPFSSPIFATVIPEWTMALTGFQAGVTITKEGEVRINQIKSLYYEQKEWLTKTAGRLDIGTLNEHEPGNVLFMGIFRNLQARYAKKENMNPHKLAVILNGNYGTESPE